MPKKKQIPAWYRIYLEKKLQRLETALKWLDDAERLIIQGFPYLAKIDLNIAKRIISQK